MTIAEKYFNEQLKSDEFRKATQERTSPCQHQVMSVIKPEVAIRPGKKEICTCRGIH